MFSSSIAWADPSGRSPELAAFGAQIGPPDRFAPATPVAPHPLPPGKPAGVRQAQAISMGTIGVGALVLIAVAGYAISTPPYHIPGQPTVTASTSTQP